MSHIKFYSELLKKGIYGVKEEASSIWLDIMKFILEESDPFGIVCGIHLLIEPFNHTVVTELIKPFLESEDVEGINKLIKDEENHVELGQRLIHYFRFHGSFHKKDLLLKFEQHSRHFMMNHSDGILNLKNKEVIQISSRARRSFMKSIKRSKSRLLEVDSSKVSMP